MMRSRSEILGEGLEAVKAETVLTQSDLKLTLLTVEALVDIRDQLPVLCTLLSRLLVNTTQDP